jgi:outer membrane protein OmpA-like peptidoglycan-associated protein
MPRPLFFLPAIAALLLAACASQPPEAVQAPPTPGRSVPGRSVSPAPQPPAPPDVQKSRLDRLQSKLNENLRGREVEVTRLADGALLLRIPDTLAFAANEAKPQPALLTVLDRLAEALNLEPATQVTIEGHTDSLGREVFNQTLSSRRADQVAAYLGTRGVAFNRLTAVGRGEAEPLADNATEAGRARNRRVDILIRGS